MLLAAFHTAEIAASLKKRLLIVPQFIKQFLTIERTKFVFFH